MSEEIAQLLDDTANMLRGMTLDPAIPAHAKDAMRSRIVKLESAAAPVPAREWTPVGERLPDAIPVLAYGENSHGKGRRMRAQFVRKGTLEDGADDETGEYDEAKDAYFWPEGWYEWNECEETHWRIDIPVTHWMPLPPPPAAPK